MKKISILGATGSIGRNTLDLISRDRNQFKVVGLTGANTWISTIASQTGRTGTVLFNIEIDAATTSMTANKDIAIELAGQANAAAGYNIRPTAANKVADLISGTVAIIDTFLELGMLDD